MKKVAIIYWSNGGNVEVLAEHIAKGAKDSGAEVIIKQVQQAKVEDVISADAVAFGSPSMDDNRVEQHEMQPFINEFKLIRVEEKKTVLFGSFGWDNGEFMDKWKVTMKDFGFNIVDDLTVNEAPNPQEIEKAEQLGKMLAK